MSGKVETKITKLPALPSEHSRFIRPRKLSSDEPPLRLTIVQGRRQFPVLLRLAENENGDRITMRHLAEGIMCETGLRPRDQKLYYKNFTWQDPDMGPWSPALRDIGIKNGDKIHLVNFQKPFCDWKEMETLERIEKENAECTKDLHMFFYRLHGVNQGFVDGNSQIQAFSVLKEHFDQLKCKLLQQIQVLNSITLDYCNTIGQARRHKLLEHTQRQVDQCTEVACTIFHKFAQSHYLANVGKIFPRGMRSSPFRSKWT